MDDVEQLINVLLHEYGLTDFTLHSVHQFVHYGRGIYQVKRRTQLPLLARAYHQAEETVEWLTGCAATLLFLEQTHYPVPQVIRTINRELVGQHQGWVVLLLTFIEGTMANGSLDHLWLIGAALGQLHKADPARAANATPSLPQARWQPMSRLADLTSQMEAIEWWVPQELHGLYRFSLDTLQHVQAWTGLPITILHADCSPLNAIRTATSSMILIDWDHADLGPAVLDLGYLLVTCHLNLPEWPAIKPNAACIAAVMDGYGQQRILTEIERSVLPDAIRFAEAFRAAMWLLEVAPGDWQQHRGLQRFHARYPVTEEIAQYAVQCFERFL